MKHLLKEFSYLPWIKPEKAREWRARLATIEDFEE
jgi:hypothetical protein